MPASVIALLRLSASVLIFATVAASPNHLRSHIHMH